MRPAGGAGCSPGAWPSWVLAVEVPVRSGGRVRGSRTHPGRLALTRGGRHRAGASPRPARAHAAPPPCAPPSRSRSRARVPLHAQVSASAPLPRGPISFHGQHLGGGPLRTEDSNKPSAIHSPLTFVTYPAENVGCFSTGCRAGPRGPLGQQEAGPAGGFAARLPCAQRCHFEMGQHPGGQRARGLAQTDLG